MSKVIIAGGGPAGMMAAIAAALNGAGSVVLLEHNEKLGKKLFITGKGRCNLTNACDRDKLFDAIYKNPKFLYSAIYAFDNRAVMDFFEDRGLRLKTERGERVFPLSDHSSDVIKALQEAMRELGVTVRLGAEVKKIVIKEDRAAGVELKGGEILEGDSVIIATGGKSYASTGSTGDGYGFAKSCGHQVSELYPSLVPLECREDYVKALQGLSLKNVSLKIYSGNKKIYDDFGEMLFTHFGISGPLVLSASGFITDRDFPLRACIDLKPALDKAALDKRLLREFDENKNKNFINVLPSLLPSKLVPVVAELSGIDPYKKVNSVEKRERESLLGILKEFPLTIIGTRDFNEAIITRGGVSVKGVNPKTMESKLLPGLYFAGEVLDLDARTGGFNLQIAWSSGYLAGKSAAKA